MNIAKIALKTEKTLLSSDDLSDQPRPLALAFEQQLSDFAHRAVSAAGSGYEVGGSANAFPAVGDRKGDARAA